jgi:hypothetical protein
MSTSFQWCLGSNRPNNQTGNCSIKTLLLGFNICSQWGYLEMLNFFSKMLISSPYDVPTCFLFFLILNQINNSSNSQCPAEEAVVCQLAPVAQLLNGLASSAGKCFNLMPVCSQVSGSDSICIWQIETST